ncbi:MAG: amino acid adenylation domain-containing protein [Anaerolineales bacterium]|nr:amino acid adenylation domain-containing protein [Anaerolineales bacterium]
MEESLKQQTSSLQVRDLQHYGKTNYPLTVVIAPGPDLEVHLVYDPSLFSQDVVQQMASHVRQVLLSMLSDPDQPLKGIQMLPPDEARQILLAWNHLAETGGEADKPEATWAQRPASVVQLFQSQARLLPDQAAGIYVDEQGKEQLLSYRELDLASDRLAVHLRQIGVVPETLVGVSLNRSLEVLVAFLGILKAGGAYVPLDPKYPADRLAFMIQDSGIKALLTQETIRPVITEALSTTLENIPVIDIRLPVNFPSHEPVALDLPGESQLAYVIYTSGTTGQPKGVMIPHSALANHASEMAEVLALKPGSRIAQLVSLSFDAAGEEIYPTLSAGGTVVFPPAEFEMSGKNIIAFLDQHQLNILHLPAPLWMAVVDEMDKEGLQMPSRLETLLVGGESPAIDKIKTWSSLSGKLMRFINAYGPSEATITATCFMTTTGSNASLDFGQAPIGRPLKNVQVFILDQDLNPLPIGVPGDIYIGGAGLARGYLKRPELTAERFIANPLRRTLADSLDISGLSPVLYRTGDVGRFLPGGEILFAGRSDHQVKLRGFRIELEEIETVLRQIAEIEGCVVILREDQPGDKRLAAYLELPDDRSFSQIRSLLKERLPEYMIPSWFVAMPSLPRLPNGKLDRRGLMRLPAPGEAALFGAEYTAPRDAVEEIIAGLWIEVLGVDRPGVFDNFFELGGHSLKATQLLSRLRQTFQIDLPLRNLFESPTISGMADAVRKGLSGEAESVQPIQPLLRDPVTGLPIQAPPLSFSQQRLWFLDQLDPGNLTFNIPAAVKITGLLNLKALEQSLNQLIERHESLRTVFDTRSGQPVQIVLPELVISLVFETPAGEVLSSEEIEAWAASQVRIPFNLATGPLIRAALLRVHPEESVLVVTIHHIVADGWSMGILIREIATIYTELTLPGIQETPELPGPTGAVRPAVLQYADYAAWQRQMLSGDELERQLYYWKDRLAGSPPLLDLPTDRPRPALKTANGDMASFTLPGPLSEAIQALARQEGVTVYMLLLAAYQTLLYRYSGQEDFNVGSAIANRTRPEVQGMIGFFVNTLVLRADLSGNPGFRELLGRVRETALGAYAHQDLPFEMLVEVLQPQRNLSYTPLFQVGFDLQEVPVKSVETGELTLTPLLAHSGSAEFDLLMSINQSPGMISGSLEYNTDLFDPETIQRLLGHFEQLLSAMVADPDLPVTALPMLSETELTQLLIDWNQSDAPFAKEACIHTLFEAHAARAPDQLALIYQASPQDPVQTLTYAELDRRANLVGHYLNRHGIGPDAFVGISTERSFEMMIAILGILKAGGAYLPLDPNYPTDRLAFMLSDSKVQIILTQSSVAERLGELFTTQVRQSGKALQVVRLDQDWGDIEKTIASTPGSPVVPVGPENLAYVIYTSGSTGRPKGALLRHRGLCNLVEWQRKAFEITPASRILQFSPFSFDASVWETFMALANGATLCLTSQETLANGLDLLRFLRQTAITTVTLPPSVLSVLPEDQVSSQALPGLKTVIAAGEACSREIVARWGPGRRFFNAYGPTETTVCASAGLADPQEERDPSIGRPIANTYLYNLDRQLQPVGVGIPGELFVGGVGVARGYLNRPELTAEKFVQNPLAAILHKAGLTGRAAEKLYRTGDLVRWRLDGSLEFLGRIDQQVKLRGFRIELGEIESALRQYEEVVPGDPGQVQRLLDVAVVVRDDLGAGQMADKRLMAFVVPQVKDPALEPASLRKFLSQTLPEYMIPSAFIALDEMPLSPSGKIDRQALATRPVERSARDQASSIYVAPRNETELQLCRICSELLGIPWSGEQSPIGVEDNFFELGGHSLLATQFISHIREAFKVEIQLRALFEHPTIAEIAAAVEQLRQAGTGLQTPAIRAVARDARRMRQTSAGLVKTDPSEETDKEDSAADSSQSSPVE